jgi:hypothetical protein
MSASAPSDVALNSVDPLSPPRPQVSLRIHDPDLTLISLQISSRRNASSQSTRNSIHHAPESDGTHDPTNERGCPTGQPSPNAWQTVLTSLLEAGGLSWLPTPSTWSPTSAYIMVMVILVAIAFDKWTGFTISFVQLVKELKKGCSPT